MWYAKYRLPDGRQVQKKLGPAWTDRGRPANGYFTKRTAEDWLRTTLEQARRGELPGMVRTGATFADACEEFMRYVTEDRQRKPSTLAGYRSIIDSMLKPAFGESPVESVTTEAIETWLTGLPQSARTKTFALVLMHGIFRRAKKVWSLPSNPSAEVEKPSMTRSGEIQVFSPEEVWALVRAAGSEQDGAIILTAAFTGLRMGELLALRWRDVDFAQSAVRVRASFSAGHLTTPTSGRLRARTLPRRSRNSVDASTGPVTTISCSRRKPAPTWMGRRCAAATRRRSPPPDSDLCAFTIYAIPSGRG